MESVLQNTVTAAGMMSCPKCGFAQEKRVDCKKCGVVFSKYYALFPSSRAGEGNPAETSYAQESPAPEFRLLIDGLQGQVQALSGLCSQIEFEKAERNQLRQDLKSLERQLIENVERLDARMDNPPPPQVEAPPSDPRIPEIRDRLEQAEAALGSFEFAGQYMVELSEKGEVNARQLADLQQQIALLRTDLDTVRSQLESIIDAQKSEEPRTSLEEDVYRIRKNLDEFRAILTKPAQS